MQFRFWTTFQTYAIRVLEHVPDIYDFEFSPFLRIVDFVFKSLTWHLGCFDLPDICNKYVSDIEINFPQLGQLAERLSFNAHRRKYHEQTIEQCPEFIS